MSAGEYEQAVQMVDRPQVSPRDVLTTHLAGDKLQEIEISPQSIAMAQALAHRVASQDGAALIIDYGQEDAYGSSLQAIHQHKFVPLLSRPGEADLSCRVDFSALR